MRPFWRSLVFLLCVGATIAWTQGPLWGEALVPVDRLWGEDREPHHAALRVYEALGLAGTDAQLEAVRAMGMLLVLVLALAAASVARRVLRPYTTESVAQAAGEASAVYVAAHPFVVAAAARPKAHADLLACALVALSLAILLRARQLRRPVHLTQAAVYAVVAAALSPVARVLPLLYGLLEYGAGPRPRPLWSRVRAAGTAFASAALLVVLGEFAAHALSQSLGWSEQRLWSGGSLLRWIETLGFVLFPAHSSAGVAGAVAAALVWLVALEPLLRAARSAPRLWGKLALAAFLTVIVALPWAVGPHAAGRVDGSEHLLAAGAATAVALAIAATAISGLRRTLLPLCGAVALATLARGATLDMVAAARAADQLGRNLAAQGAGVAELLVLEPPREAAGFALWRHSVAERVPPGAARTRIVEERALPWLCAGERGALLRKQGLAISRTGEESLRLPWAEGLAAGVVWRSDGRSPLVDLDPWLAQRVRVLPLPGVSLDEAPVMGWRGVDEGGATGRLSGVWGLVDGAPVALFDMALRPDWTSARTVRRVWFEAPLTSLKSAEVQAAPFYTCSDPRVEGDDWVIDAVEESWQPSPSAAPHSPETVLVRLLSQESLVWFEREALRDAAGAGLWRVRGLQRDMERAVPAGEAYDWWIERIVGATVVAGSSGTARR